MRKSIMLLWGESLSDLTEGSDTNTIKEAELLLVEVQKFHSKAWRIVSIYNDGDFKPSREVIHAESEFRD